MKSEYLKQEVLALYDVRGIQNFIFKTNAVKEIVGASVIVRDIITEGLRSYIDENVLELERTYYMIDWENDDPGRFLEDPLIKMQIMFVGGGNAYVLFRSGEECQKVNRYLGKYVLEKTYSLKLAVAVVPKSNDYRRDYSAINLEMQRIKAEMPLSMPLGALPFMKTDSVTGYPLTSKDDKGECSTESRLKREAYQNVVERLEGKQRGEKIFDEMVTEKGDSSTLAIFHIDGNRMGSFIKNTMQDIQGYEEAIKTMRKLSGDIAGRFRTVVDMMKDYMNELAVYAKTQGSSPLYREIIVAGDDITFVCNAKLALPAVQYFLENIGDDEYGFSACGGIAYFNSHFPFSDAYKVAEACCDSSKARAKQQDQKGDDGEIGNYLDFQVCRNVSAADLDDYREKHYRVKEDWIIQRPYCVKGVAGRESASEPYAIGKLNAWMSYFSQQPTNKMKELRDAIPGGKVSREKEISFLASRGYDKIQKESGDWCYWYDALEIMDWMIV